MQMAETMFGNSIQIVSATYSGDPQSGGIYSNALEDYAPGVARRTPG